MKSKLISQLEQALCCLPGVGAKSAQRMAMHLLERDPQKARMLSFSIDEALTKIKHCQQCRIYTEEAICTICQDQMRDTSKLCVVEQPSDCWMIEQTGQFNGYYFVLYGKLSPIEGITPDTLGLDDLASHIQQSLYQEVVVATSTTLEGEATAHYIAELVDQLQFSTVEQDNKKAQSENSIKVTRLAHGMPVGGELEYLDANTLSYALTGRQQILVS